MNEQWKNWLARLIVVISTVVVLFMATRSEAWEIQTRVVKRHTFIGEIHKVFEWEEYFLTTNRLFTSHTGPLTRRVFLVHGQFTKVDELTLLPIEQDMRWRVSPVTNISDETKQEALAFVKTLPVERFPFKFAVVVYYPKSRFMPIPQAVIMFHPFYDKWESVYNEFADLLNEGETK